MLFSIAVKDAFVEVRDAAEVSVEAAVAAGTFSMVLFAVAPVLSVRAVTPDRS
jgi:hypothetical protein